MTKSSIYLFCTHGILIKTYLLHFGMFEVSSYLLLVLQHAQVLVLTTSPSFPPSFWLSVCTGSVGSGADERIILCDISLSSSELSCVHCDKLGWGSLNGSVLFWAPARFSDFSFFPGPDSEQLLSSSLIQPSKFELGFNFSARISLIQPHAKGCVL